MSYQMPNTEPCVAGLCTLCANSPSSSGFEEVESLQHPISQSKDKPTACVRNSVNKHTGEEDSCVEECNLGTLKVTRHWQAER